MSCLGCVVVKLEHCYQSTWPLIQFRIKCLGRTLSISMQDHVANGKRFVIMSSARC